MAEPRKNAIVRRLDKLCGLWSGFAEQSEPRLLRWLVAADDRTMMETFFNLQAEGNGELPDLFLQFRVPFASPQTYASQLLEDLRTQYQDSRESLREAGLDDAWSVPPLTPGSVGPAAVLAACDGFQRHYRQAMLRLAVVLSPTRIDSANEWAAWLHALLELVVPEAIRFTVIDLADAPTLDALCAAHPQRIVTIAPRLDMAAAVEEISSTSGARGPGADFQRLFIKLSNLIGGGDMGRIRPLADRALAIATREAWSAQVATIHFMVAAAQNAAGRTDDCIESYRAALAAAQTLRAEQNPAGPKLALQACFGIGTALVLAGRNTEAAPAYGRALPFAREGQDQLMEMEAWRMAGYCYEQANDLERARTCGFKALEVGAELARELRRQSTLAHAGVALLRVTNRLGDQHEGQRVRARLVELCGTDWEQLAA